MSIFTMVESFQPKLSSVLVSALWGGVAVGLCSAGAAGAVLYMPEGQHQVVNGDRSGDSVEIGGGTATIVPGTVLGKDALGISLRQNNGFSTVGSGARLLGGIEMTDGAVGRFGEGPGPQAQSYRLAMGQNAVARLDNIQVRSSAQEGSEALHLQDNAAVTMTANTSVKSIEPWGDGMDLLHRSSAVVDGSHIEGYRSGVQTAGSSQLLLNGADVAGGVHGLTASQNSLVMVSGGQITSLGTHADAHGDVDNSGLFALADVSGEASLLVDISNHALIQARGARSAGLLVEAARAPLDVSVRDSVIRGDRDGIVVNRYSVYSDPSQLATLKLAGTQVVGGSGAAIRVDRDVQADIVLSRGTTLHAGNGVALQTERGSRTALTVENTVINGRAQNNGGSTDITLGEHGAWNGDMHGVSAVTVNDGARWTMDDSSEIGRLALNGGTVGLNGGSRTHTLTAQTLSGHGNFALNTDLAGQAGDKVVVSGQATGDHRLMVADTGRAIADPRRLQVVKTGGGGADFTLVNGTVDLGAYRYGLKRDGANWNLEPLTTQPYSASATSVLNLVSTTPTIWYGQVRTLQSRLGELRFERDQGGAWARPYASDYRIKSVTGGTVEQRQNGIALGADKGFAFGGGKAYLGGVFNYSSASLNNGVGASGSVDAYSVGMYGVWLAPSGFYLHGLANLNQFRDQGQAVMSNGVRASGSYHQNGVGVSLEAGRRVALPRDWFVQPYAQLAGVRMNGASVALDNGLRAEANHVASIQGSLGASLGKTLHTAGGGALEPYLRLAVSHEFIRNNNVMVNGQAFDADLDGSRLEVGVGVSGELGKRLSAHLDYAYATGPRLEKPFMIDAGLRYQW
ncbi:autotransporter outer membrane beta-barrel domain-containing protein [Chromobacterium vaccinii]|uniref:autotransporter outer membrane beta-barrel domain-containing protein n=1 Tax=Chromobacterium TaxID=535 RepID=UPI0013052AED|nr:autotransporter outer membrane beta-barrel domain-containing protein [Chromobacterium sp. ATCC 53434]